MTRTVPGIRLSALLLLCGFAAVIAHASPFAYVLKDGGVAVIDVETNLVVRDIALAGVPQAVATRPGARYAFVASDAVHVIDALTQDPVSRLALADAELLAVDGQQRLFAEVGTQVSVFQADTSSAGSFAIPAPGKIAFNGAGTRMFIARTSSAQLDVLGASAPWPVERTIALDAPAQGLAAHPAQERVYYAANGIVRSADIDPGVTAPSVSLAVGAGPNDLAIDPAGRRLFVSNKGADTVTIIDATRALVLATVAVGDAPEGIDVTPDGDFVYVVNTGSGTVSVISMATMTVVKVIPIGPGARANGRFIGGAPSPAHPAPSHDSALWWNPVESGWGVHVTRRDSTFFAAWFTYDAAGRPHWYTAPACRPSVPLACADCLRGVTCQGAAYATSGTVAIATREAGTMELQFSGPDAATFKYTVDGISRRVNIQRQLFAEETVSPPVDYSDLWWNPRESGRGLAVSQQDGIMFLVWFAYDANGHAEWTVASDCRVIESGNGCRGTLYRTTGPGDAMGASPFDFQDVSVVGIGTVELDFTDPDHGFLAVTVNGRTERRTLTRQLF